MGEHMGSGARETYSPHASDRRTVALALIVMAGLAFRVAYVLTRRDLMIHGDGEWIHNAANFLADGRGFIDAAQTRVGLVEPTAHFPPAWTAVLAFPSWLGFRTVLDHQLWSCALGAATIGVVGTTARHLAGARAGLLAAAVTALYPNFWMYERVLQSETLVLLLASIALLSAFRFWRRPGPLGAVTAGVLCGLLALTRAELILLLGLLLVPLIWLCRGVSRPRRTAWLVMAGAAAFATMAPWVAYNLNRFDHTVLLTDSFGSTVRVANCPSVYFGRYVGWWDHRCFTARPPGSRGALEYAQAHVDQLPIVLFAREGRTWGFFRPSQQTLLDTLGGPELSVTRLGLYTYWPLAALAVTGAVVLRRRHEPLFPLVAFVVTVAVAVALTFGQTRYRADAEVPILLLAVVAVDAALSRMLGHGAERHSVRPH